MIRNLLPLCLLITGCGPLQALDWCRDKPIIIRSAQPSHQDLKYLADKYGLKTIINLRPLDEAGGDWYMEEINSARQLLIDFYTIDLNDGTTPPMAWQVEKYFSLVSDPRRWPILIHCQSGIHRTGVMAALYRIQFQGWSNEQAIREMESYWYDWSLDYRKQVKDWLRAFQKYPKFNIKRHECY